AREHCPPRERRAGPVRDADEVPQLHDRRRGDLEPLGAEHDAIGRDDVRLLLEDEDHGPARGNDGQRLERNVDDQRSAHVRIAAEYTVPLPPLSHPPFGEEEPAGPWLPYMKLRWRNFPSAEERW